MDVDHKKCQILLQSVLELVHAVSWCLDVDGIVFRYLYIVDYFLITNERVRVRPSAAFFVTHQTVVKPIRCVKKYFRQLLTDAKFLGYRHMTLHKH